MTASWGCIPVCLLSHISVFFLQSSNGTYINKSRILSEREVELRDGDLIGIGISEITDADCYVFRLCRKFFEVMQLSFSCLYTHFLAKFRIFGVFVYTFNFHSSFYL